MTGYQRIEKVIRHLDRGYREQPTLVALAKIAGLSEFHFQRMFRRWAGTTPKSFVKHLTAAHAKRLLRESRDVLDTALQSGLSGPGRLHDLMVTTAAVTPGEYKSGGQGVEIRFGLHATPFGPALVGVTSRGICHLSFGDMSVAQARREIAAEWPRATLVADSRPADRALRQIFSTRSRSNPLRLLLKGTPFQLKVWQALLRLPEGQVASYSTIARVVGSPRASRAVGSAVAQNSIGFLIPCHRVIRETGVIGDYRWGSDRKRALLAWEQARR